MLRLCLTDIQGRMAMVIVRATFVEDDGENKRKESILEAKIYNVAKLLYIGETCSFVCSGLCLCWRYIRVMDEPIEGNLDA